MAILDNEDLKALKNLMQVTIEEVVENKELLTKDDMAHLPTKDEFYGVMDKVMGELKAIREEVAVLEHQVSEYTDRLDRIESNQVHKIYWEEAGQLQMALDDGMIIAVD